MSVQCKNCKFAKKEGTKTKCIRWKNCDFVNIKKQRLCDGFIKNNKVY